jgi:hypothetical protein
MISRFLDAVRDSERVALPRTMLKTVIFLSVVGPLLIACAASQPDKTSADEWNAALIKEAVGGCDTGIPEGRQKIGTFTQDDLDVLAVVYRDVLVPAMNEYRAVRGVGTFDPDGWWAGTQTEVLVSLGTLSELNIIPSDSFCVAISTADLRVIPERPMDRRRPHCHLRLVGWPTEDDAVVWWEIAMIDPRMAIYYLVSSALVTRTPGGWRVCANVLLEAS